MVGAVKLSSSVQLANLPSSDGDYWGFGGAQLGSRAAGSAATNVGGLVSRMTQRKSHTGQLSTLVPPAA
jgi:hypothetical protein